jgi:hypothetical protein
VRELLTVVGVVFALIAAGFVLLSWWSYRAQPDTSGWTRTTATVVAHRRVPLVRGTATEAVGRYVVNGSVIEAVVRRGRNAWRDGRWEPPADTPAIGAVTAVQYDPADPRRVVPADTPREPWMAPWRIVFVGILVVLAALCWIAPAAAQRR